MNLLKSVSTIASSSLITQLIGAGSIWVISNRFGMGEVGGYALIFSIMLIGAQIAVFGSQLLIPKQKKTRLYRNIVYCLLQGFFTSIVYSIVAAQVFEKNIIIVFLLTISQSWVYISENLLLRDEKIKALSFQRLSISILIVSSVLFSEDILHMYYTWSIGQVLLIAFWLNYSISWRHLFKSHLFSIKGNVVFFKRHRSYLLGVGSADVLGMVNSNLPVLLITYWFSPLVAGYFAVVNRFCFAPVNIVGNAVRNSIFSKWSIDFRNNMFNFEEYKKVRFLLFSLGIVATLGVLIFYPIVMNLGFSEDWISSIPTSQYMLPLLFASLAICPLTVIELVFGSPRYFFQIQIEQLLVIVVSLIVFPHFSKDYGYAVLCFSILSTLRYFMVFYKVNKRAVTMMKQADIKQG